MWIKIPFKIDTYDKALKMIEILTKRKATERLALVLRYFPECKKMTQQQLGEVINMDRETVTRTLSKIRRK
jgi:DNA-binding MarR family transcriptional regulator